MNYDFYIEKSRIHLEDDNTIILRGWFRDDNPQNREIIVTDGDMQLPVTIAKRCGMAVRQRYMFRAANVSEEITVEIPLAGLSSVGKAINGIRIFSCLNGRKKLVAKLSGKEIQRMRREIPMRIEGFSFDEGTGTLVISGWALGVLDANFILQKQGTRIAAEVSRTYRRDVTEIFGELESSEIRELEEYQKIGFKIVAENISNLKDIELILRRGNEINRILVDDISKKLSLSMFQKGIIYLKIYGIRMLLSKVFLKLPLGWKNPEKLKKSEYLRWRKQYEVKQDELEQQKKQQGEFDYYPCFSIVVPIYRTNHKHLEAMLNSVETQTYLNWQLCLADGSGEEHLLESIVKEHILAEAKRGTNRIVYKALDANRGISENTNRAIELATGEYIVFGDHDDVMAPNALFEFAKLINCVDRKDGKAVIREGGYLHKWEEKAEEYPDVIYSDEDKLDMSGKKYFEPHFKSDFNIDLLCSMNYVCHLFAVSATLLEHLKARDGVLLRKEYDGAQDHDFIFRCCEIANRVCHVPKILYHWRCSLDSTASNPESKMYAFEAGRKAVEAHYQRCGIPAEVAHGQFYGIFRTKYCWEEQPLISIIIPNKDHVDDLKKCIDSIDCVSTYRNYEFIIVENNSTEEATFGYYKELGQRDNVKIVYYEGGFNFSSINNAGVTYAKGDYLLLLNNDTELLAPDGLWELLSPCMRTDVGVVGARLYYSDDTVQHGGVVLGFGGIAGHAFIGSSRYDNGYFNRLICAQDLSAVTAACMMVKKSVYEQVGGLTESFEVAFNDIDFCMKVRKEGYLIIYNPAVEFYHYESKSRGLEDTPEKVARFNAEVSRFIEKWNDELMAGDPYYNPNLSLIKADYSLKE